MSCDNSTYCTAIVDLGAYCDLAAELRDYPTSETDVERDQSVKRCRSGPRSEPIADEPKSQGRRQKSRSCVIADSTHTNPQYVWGDEGPVNE
jgi:hypothetical protein